MGIHRETSGAILIDFPSGGFYFSSATIIPKSCGASKNHATGFRENNTDETVLTNLTAEDLKELGVASLLY